MDDAPVERSEVREVTCPRCGWTVLEGGSHVCQWVGDDKMTVKLMERLRPEPIPAWKLRPPTEVDKTIPTVGEPRRKPWVGKAFIIPRPGRKHDR